MDAAQSRCPWCDSLVSVERILGHLKEHLDQSEESLQQDIEIGERLRNWRWKKGDKTESRCPTPGGWSYQVSHTCHLDEPGGHLNDTAYHTWCQRHDPPCGACGCCGDWVGSDQWQEPCHARGVG